eukprot:Hpha_TRINITY_DN16889_c2_g1::TRINITY_DN16889_c2_g1_i1::g.148268::m.148268
MGNQGSCCTSTGHYCCQSEPAAQPKAYQARALPPAADKPAEKPAGPSKPMAMPFAVMRNTHEAFIKAIEHMAAALDSGDTAGFKQQFERYQRALEVHAKAEDDGMFPLLQSLGGPIKEEGLPDEHVKDGIEVAAVFEALATGNATAISESFRIWREDHIAHLNHEVKVMMPVAMKTGSTPAERATVFHNKIMKYIDEAGEDGDFLIEYVVRLLATEGSTKEDAVTASRVFTHGLWAASNKEQWARWKPVVQEAIPSGHWDKMAAQAADLNAPAPVPY